MSTTSARLLILRFSSFGDIVQACGVPQSFLHRFSSPTATAEVDWLTRSDFTELLTSHPHIQTVYSFDRKQGLAGLLKTAWKLAGLQHSHIYDAHNNVRSRIVCFVFFIYHLLHPFHHAPQFIRRPKHRLRRWLFFKFRFNTLPVPFRGAESFHAPLIRWGMSLSVPDEPVFFVSPETIKSVAQKLGLNLAHRPVIGLAPSAAWEMKRWPVEHWQSLIRALPDAQFVLFGGPDDHFISDIATAAPERCLNMAGRLSLIESCAALHHVRLLISGDTGLMHAGDQMARPTLALIGPTAFGFPSHRTSKTAVLRLPCQPCSKDGRGRCVNTVYKRCLKELTPLYVAQLARELL